MKWFASSVCKLVGNWLVRGFSREIWSHSTYMVDELLGVHFLALHFPKVFLKFIKSEKTDVYVL